ncbi:MAG: hypothetical protein ACFFAT_03355 [Promethearchaeota archaeon]
MDAGDICGLISNLAGTALLLIPFPTAIAPFVWLIGGAAVLVLAIVGVSLKSKIGIGGIILGALGVFIGLVYLLLGNFSSQLLSML